MKNDFYPPFKIGESVKCFDPSGHHSEIKQDHVGNVELCYYHDGLTTKGWFVKLHNDDTHYLAKRFKTTYIKNLFVVQALHLRTNNPFPLSDYARLNCWFDLTKPVSRQTAKEHLTQHRNENHHHYLHDTWKDFRIIRATN